ncbi:winged helix-turn-helix domain-containing protein [Nonomuraea sp. NBC_01738]|uniref:BTAD domain-containing putative transcriptional regulator n=1 Tax=Nonomuraea sp. NBC_01738 TaxID=2976003 RepID=UPI002E12FD17|nr:winged helix-turn-helix domain-containing protein [Nonomuraea sp. NBC_01738]
MRVEILGTPQAGVPISGTRLRWLLVRLALAEGRAVTVSELAAALWPDEQPADPANAVQSLVSRLRRALPDPAVLASVPGGYRLHAACDAAEFESLVRQARAAGSAAESVAALEHALALWRGPALGDLADAPFAVGYAARLEEARLSALEDLYDHLTGATATDAGDHDLAGELGELCAGHPLRERLQAARIRALHRAGRTAEALVAYEDVRTRLAAELGADPGAALRDLHLALLREPAPVVQRTNLRAPLTSFVGRETEVERVREQLTTGRLVTLLGPGGAGKTRLATMFAATLVADRPVWVVELAPVTDAHDVMQATLAALGNPAGMDGSGVPRDTLGRLVAILSGGPVLLVLDNCEHLLDAAARLADDLLGRCPDLRVLATSREPLGILGETLSPLGPLPPELAARLFTERARAANPALPSMPGVLVAEICTRLDGLPLAIELAAARLRSLTPEQVAARLDDRFALLTGGSRTALPRHQTLRAVVAWSWDLADVAERALAERLAVFPGTFDAAAAERVAFGGAGTFERAAQPGETPAAPYMLDRLAALVDKSLLQSVAGGRYRMLETIREYALERLQDPRQARAAHAANYLALAEAAEPHLRSREQVEWIALLVAEHDNLLAALHFAAGAHDAETAVRLAAALGQFWTVWGNRSDSVGWLRLALEVPGPAPQLARTVARAVYLINDSFTSSGPADRDRVTGALAELVAEADLDADHPILALVEPVLALFTDDDELGHAAIERRLAHPDPWTRAVMRMARGAIRENTGDMTGMLEDLLAAEHELEKLGERWARSQALTMLGGAHTVGGDFPAAIEALETAIELIGELAPDDVAGQQRVWLANARVLSGDVERGKTELLAMAGVPAHNWRSRDIAFAQLELGDLARRSGDVAEAGRRYEQAAATIHRLPAVAPQFRALILAQRAHLAAELGELAQAVRWVDEAVELSVLVKDMPVLARIGLAGAAIWVARGGYDTAAQVLGAAEHLRGSPDRFHPDVIALTGRLRAELGEAGFHAAYAAGRALARPAAVALMSP